MKYEKDGIIIIYQLAIFKGFVDIVLKNSNVESIDFHCSNFIADEYCTFVIESYEDVCNAINDKEEFDSNIILATVIKSLHEYIENNQFETRPEFPDFVKAVSHYISDVSKLYALDK